MYKRKANTMEQINFFLSNFCLSLQKDIIDCFERTHAYIKDLFSFKKITIYSKLGEHTDFQKKEIIQKIITSTNSALNTIGIPMEDLTPIEYLIEKVYNENIYSYKNYNELYDNELKLYVNKYLFNSLIEYIIERDIKKVENLDLFDLLPSKFKKKLVNFRLNNPISLEQEQILFKVLQHITHYIDLNSINIIIGSFNEPPPEEKSFSEEEIMNQLKEAKESTLSLLQDNSEIDKAYLSKDLEDLRGAILELSENGNPFIHYFGNFAQLHQEVFDQLPFNSQNLINFVRENLDFFDLENLFYFISIAKLIGFEIPIDSHNVIEILKSYTNGRIFSSGAYHKPNPISNAYGLSILSELNLIEETEFIDLLDIEMSLENEFKNFLPEKTLINFYTLIALNILDKQGNVIKDKTNLVKNLESLDVSTFSEKVIPLDILCHLSIIHLIQKNVDLSRLKQIYISELKNSLQPNGSINNNLTDSARALLALKLMELENKNENMVNSLIYFLKNSTIFFAENQQKTKFHWTEDPIAFKIELRMLFWVSLAFLEFQDIV